MTKKDFSDGSPDIKPFMDSLLEFYRKVIEKDELPNLSSNRLRVELFKLKYLEDGFPLLNE